MHTEIKNGSGVLLIAMITDDNVFSSGNSPFQQSLSQSVGLIERCKDYTSAQIFAFLDLA
jgi:hypothetical protein